MPKNLDQFHLTFIGEEVEILANITTMDKKGEAIPLVITGLLLDLDDDHLYLGHNNGDDSSIDRAIKRSIVGYIQIVEPFDPLSEILNQVPNDMKEAN